MHRDIIQDSGRAGRTLTTKAMATTQTRFHFGLSQKTTTRFYHFFNSRQRRGCTTRGSLPCSGSNFATVSPALKLAIVRDRQACLAGVPVMLGGPLVELGGLLAVYTCGAPEAWRSGRHGMSLPNNERQSQPGCHAEHKLNMLLGMADRSWRCRRRLRLRTRKPRCCGESAPIQALAPEGII